MLYNECHFYYIHHAIVLAVGLKCRIPGRTKLVPLMKCDGEHVFLVTAWTDTLALYHPLKLIATFVKTVYHVFLSRHHGIYFNYTDEKMVVVSYEIYFLTRNRQLKFEA